MTRLVLVEAAILLALVHLLVPLGSSTPLDDYVNRPDSSYEYEIITTVTKGGLTQYYVNMTSQTWLSSDLVSQSKWYHYLIVNIPDHLDTNDYATLHIGGGDNEYNLPSQKDQDVKIGMMLALSTNLITASLKMIPNQPIRFSEDPDKKNRDEGSLIAYTWRHFLLNTSQPEYLACLPMTKAVVRALDTITHLINKERKELSIKRFGVVGASKRGWTTWTAALVDTRIVAISPIVLDLVNLTPLLHHMYRAYNGWSFTFRYYRQENITANLDSKEFEMMTEIVDPYCYFKRLERNNISVFLINTCGDEFMMPDDNFYFWDKLPAPKYLKMIPNAEHSDIGHILSTIMDVGTFFVSVINNYKLPQTNWTFENVDKIARINFWTDTAPVEVVLWHATTLPDNPKRDFRLLAGPDPDNPTPQLIFWYKKETTQAGKHLYKGEVNEPEVGWTGCFIEATYSFKINGVIKVFQITSQANIVPNTFPYPDCHGTGCKGKLV